MVLSLIKPTANIILLMKNKSFPSKVKDRTRHTLLTLLVNIVLEVLAKVMGVGGGGGEKKRHFSSLSPTPSIIKLSSYFKLFSKSS